VVRVPATSVGCGALTLVVVDPWPTAPAGVRVYVSLPSVKLFSRACVS
jgi:hypothetical protein